jgi:hypothetical protein
VIEIIEVDKIGSATSPLNLSRSIIVVGSNGTPRAGDVVVARVLTDNATYNMLELPTGRLAKVNPGDVVVGVLGRRRALKGFVGDVPQTVKAGDELHLLNLGGVIGSCSGHHSSLNDAIKVEVIGMACDAKGSVKNIADVSLPLRETLGATAPLVVIAGACMNSGKTYAATEIIQQGTRNGLRVAAAKLSGIACLRDTLNMADHGAVATASFLDCGLPSTVGAGDLAPVAKAIITRLNESAPDLIVIELGDGILGGYSVESVFDDAEFREAMGLRRDLGRARIIPPSRSHRRSSSWFRDGFDDGRGIHRARVQSAGGECASEWSETVRDHPRESFEFRVSSFESIN